MKISPEVKIGVYSIVVIVLFVIGLNYLKGKDVFRKHRSVYAVYSSVNGLLDASPVFVNGLTVGKVTEMRFINPGAPKVLVKLTLYNSIAIPLDSKARINSDLLGTKSIQIVLGKSATAIGDGDTLQSENPMTLTEEVSQQVAPIKLKAENLLSSLDTMVTALHAVFNAETRRNLSESFSRIRTTLANLENTTYNLDTLVYGQRNRLEHILLNVESITENFKQNDQNISNILQNFSNISDSLARLNLAGTLTHVNNALTQVETITQKINQGQGSLGMLINNPTLYNNLDKSAKELDLLITDIKLNPYRYLNVSVFPPSKKKLEYQGPKE